VIAYGLRMIPRQWRSLDVTRHFLTIPVTITGRLMSSGVQALPRCQDGVRGIFLHGNTEPIHMRGLRSRPPQVVASCLDRRVYKGPPSVGRARGTRIQGGQAPLPGFLIRMRSLNGLDLQRYRSTEGDAA